MKLRPSLLSILALMLGISGWGQVEYVMSDLTVSDCSGALVDSGEGQEYSSNENYTFTVQMADVIPILVTFHGSFCLEDGFDFLTIWDGVPDASNLLATYTGTDFLPEDVVSNSGIISFVFTSDNSLNLCGFALGWEGIAPTPIPPNIQPIETFACGATGLEFELLPPVGCSDFWLDSLAILSGPPDAWDLANASLICAGDSATGFFIPLLDTLNGNCAWSFVLPVDVRDACDSLHRFQAVFDASTETCPISGTWAASTPAACIGNCMSIYWMNDGCSDHVTEWTQSGGGTPIALEDLPSGVAAGLIVCVENADTLELELSVVQPATQLDTVFTHTLIPQVIAFSMSNAQPICSTSEDVILLTEPAGGGWSDPVYFADNSWWLNTETAALTATTNGSTPPEITLTYTTIEGCALDTTLGMQYVNAGPDMTTCLGAEPFDLEGTSNLPAEWFGDLATEGLFTPDSMGVFVLTLTSTGCTDTLEIEVIPDAPPIDLGDICQSADWQELPTIDAVGFWTGPGLNNAGFDPEELAAGSSTWYYNLTGCAQLAQATILPINLGVELFSSCPAESAFIPYPNFSPTGGEWSGPGIVNAASGLFDPGVAPEGWGQTLYYLAPNGCEDVVMVNNITTAISATSFETCSEGVEYDLHNNAIGAVPWCGTWTGNWTGASATSVVAGSGSSVGLAVESWCDWDLIPNEINPGLYELIFTANTCSDTLSLQVYPSELNLEPVIACSDADPIALADSDWPLGGIWDGSGVEASTGWLTPGAAETGWQDVTWTAPGGCTDVVAVQVEAWEQAAILNADTLWCFQETQWIPELYPASNCTWTLDGTSPEAIEIAWLDTGYHAMTVAWNGTACASTDSISFYMLSPLSVELTVSDTVICPGQATQGNAEVTGGFPGAVPDWNWSHGGFAISNTVLQTDSSQFLVVTASDGCSDVAQDSVFITALPPPLWELTLGDTLCYGASSSVLFACQTPGYSLWWDGNETSPEYTNEAASTWIETAAAGSPFEWLLTESTHGCSTIGEAVAPAYSPVSAGFSVNPGLECIPWDFLPIQMIDFSQFAVSGWWRARALDGDGGATTVWSIPYSQSESPVWQPDLPGHYEVLLQLENEGGCLSSDSANVCIFAPVNWFLADQFSPNGDGLNDLLLVRSEPLNAFEMRVYNRWGEQVYMANDPVEGWNGNQRNTQAPSGVYAIQLILDFADGTHLETLRHVTLVR